MLSLLRFTITTHLWEQPDDWTNEILALRIKPRIKSMFSHSSWLHISTYVINSYGLPILSSFLNMNLMSVISDQQYLL